MELSRLASPSDNDTNQASTLSVRWKRSVNATRYRTQVSESPAFLSFVFNDSTITDTSATIPNLPNATTYYWRVQGLNQYAGSAFSDVWNFTTIQPVSGSSVLAYYPFNGDANDASGNAHHGTASNATLTADRFGSIHAAYDFNGSSSAIDYGVIGIPANQFSASLWLKARSYRNSDELLYDAYGGRGWNIFLESTYKIGFLTVQSATIGNLLYVQLTPEERNSWIHIVCTSENGTIRMYVNGVLRGSQDGPLAANSNSKLVSGFDWTVNTHYFDGSLDDVSIFNRPLTQPEIVQLYDGGAPSVALLSPNGAESWEASSYHDISWNSSNIGQVKLEYSIDAGISWVTISDSTTASAGTFGWTLPNSLSGFCKVRVTDVAHPGIKDESDAFFGIAAAQGVLALRHHLPKPSRKSVIGDLNGDGKNEMACTFGQGSASRVTIYSYNGVAQQFDSLWGFAAGTTAYWTYPLIADVDTDGKNELIVTGDNGDAGGFVKIFEHGSGNSWSEAWTRNFATVRRDRGVSVGDADNDGKNEMIVGLDWNGRTMSVFEHTGENTYTQAWSTSGNDFKSTSVADCDNDGLNEIVAGTGNWSWYDWRVYEWNGSAYALNYHSGALGSVSAIVGDANNDGLKEVIVSSNTNQGGENNLKIYHWTGSTYANDWSWNSGAASSGTALGSVLNDGKNQIAFFSGSQDVSQADSMLHLVRFDGSTYGELWHSQKFSSPFYGDCEIGDVNNDGLEALVFSHFIDGVFIYSASQPPVMASWQNTLTAGDACAGGGTLVFGGAADGTSGLDVAMGESELPPVPPSGIFDTRFTLPVAPAMGSLRDFRADTVTSATWKVTFQPGSCGYPMIFSWDSSAFPATGSFYLRDEFGGIITNVNMRSQRKYTLTVNGVSSLVIVYARDITRSVSVAAGWNLITAPVRAADSSVSALYPGATSSAYGFNNVYVTASTLSPGRGYWLKFAEGKTIHITGAQTGRPDIQVQPGWNMIGSFENDVPVGTITSSPADIVSSSLFGFSAGYTVASTLEAGKGYWVKVNQEGVLRVGSGVAKSAVAPASIDSSWARIIVQDSTGQERVLFLAPPEQILGSYELPPPAPGKVFDLRYANQAMVDTLGRAIHEVLLSSAALPLVIRGEQLRGMEFSVGDAIGGVLFKGTLREGELLRSAVALDMLRFEEKSLLEALPIPAQYALEQNYPNPFNPATTIRIALPQSAKVRLVVYNVLGQEVAELVNAVYGAGYHSVQFRADRLASGVYLYRMEAGPFTSVKKFILMK